jgi:peptidoglycan/LPS O-acetylase OafA/YrhL
MPTRPAPGTKVGWDPVDRTSVTPASNTPPRRPASAPPTRLTAGADLHHQAEGEQSGVVSVPALDRLTSLRAVAAFAVFAYHLDRWEVTQHASTARFGYAGVGFFFILSGFILVWSARPSDATRTFYRRRFARVYPAHAFTLLVAAIVPVVAVARDIPSAVLSGTMLQAWAAPSSATYGMNGVAWSLSCEAFFYLLFPLLYAWMRRATPRRRWTAVAAAFVLASATVVVGALEGGDAATIVNVNPVIRLPGFALGMAAGMAFVEGWRPRIPGPAVLCAGVAVYLIGMVADAPTPMMDAILTPVFLALIIAAAVSDVQQRGGWLTSRAFVYAGQVSFSFYLVHELVIINVAERFGGAPAVALDVVLAVAAAIALHHLVELPFQRWLRPRGKKPVGNAALN